MHTLDLSSARWTFQDPASGRWLAAAVPGCVHTDLQQHGLIPDPFWSQTELTLQWIEERAWTYRAEFDVPAAFLAEEETDLVFEGLDTVADVTLNGVKILASDNMFHVHRVPVKTRLRVGVNALEIVFGSAMEYVRTARPGFIVAESNDPVGGRYRIRKEQCQFGWDWGPRFVTVGVWRPVRLEAWSHNRLATVALTQTHADGGVTLAAVPAPARPDPAARYRLTISDGEGFVEPVEGGATDLRLRIPDPKLWWPAGQGGQPLYDVSVQFLGPAGEAVGEPWRRRVGLRTIKLDQEPDGRDVRSATGLPLARFGLRVNGRLIFAKGANWIPAHSFVAGLTRADYLPLLQAARDAHMNLMRVWGGGVYEQDAFYDVCDELGLLVWQDFMFACSLYPADPAFFTSVRREAADQVTRLRHHAALALWCGNNENIHLNAEALQLPDRAEEYRQLFMELLPAILRESDPETSYIHSSPCCPLPGQTDPTPASHDAHDWDVWHARQPVEHYLTKNHRFVSEFGMQSFPSLPVARTFCPPEELNILSPTFQNHQKNPGGNPTILDYVTRLYRLPGDYGSLAYLSQLNQAHCMKVAVEHFRRQQPQCLGTVYWQLNDCWPVASWSSLEFGGRWKVLHHAARRFFAPSLVSARHLGEESVGIGNYNRNTKGIVELWTSHDAPAAGIAILAWTLLTLAGDTLAAGSKAVDLRPLESIRQETLDFTAALDRAGRGQTVLRVRLTDAATGESLSENTVLFAAPRLLALEAVPVHTGWKPVSADAWNLTFQSHVFQHAVWCEFTAEGVAISDNAFDLFPDETRTVRVTAPGFAEPPEFTLRTVAQAASYR